MARAARHTRGCPIRYLQTLWSRGLTPLRAAALFALIALVGAGLVACSGDDEQQQAQPQAAAQAQEQDEQPAATATADQPQEQQQAQPQQQQQQQQQQPASSGYDGPVGPASGPIVFSDLNWQSSEIQVRIAAYIVEHGLGYDVDMIAGDTVLLWEGLTNGDTHVTMEIWPAQQPWIDELGPGVIEILGKSLDNNWEGWVVPQYVKDANPGLVSVFDLPEYADLFVTADSRGKARFVQCIAGWACEQVNANKFAAYDLEDVLDPIDPGSGAALFADLEGAYARGDAWLGYIWGPTKPTATLDLYRLEEPEWTEDCWNGDQGCAYPESEVRIAVHATLLDRAPDVVEFLRNWSFSANVQIPTEIWLSDNEATPDEAAIWYLENNVEHWTAFLPDSAAASVADALGISLTAAAAPAPPAEKEQIVFSDLNWQSSEIQVRIASYIVEHGYEYPVDMIAGDTVLLWEGLTNGDTHVTMEIWPAQQPWIDELGPGVIEILGKSLDNNWEGWVVPQYVKDANPGLVSVFDLPEYADLFVTADSRGKARFVQCIAGWACEQVNANKFAAYDLEDVLDPIDPGSGAALFADLEGAYARGDAWLGYIWGPTKPTATLDLYRLEEPEWTEDCWNGDQGCAYPESEVRIAVHATLLDRAPDVVEFLRNWSFSANVQIPTEIWLSDNEATPGEAAIHYLMTYGDHWTAFVPADVAERVLAALADEG